MKRKNCLNYILTCFITFLVTLNPVGSLSAHFLSVWFVGSLPQELFLYLFFITDLRHCFGCLQGLEVYPLTLYTCILNGLFASEVRASLSLLNLHQLMVCPAELGLFDASPCFVTDLLIECTAKRTTAKSRQSTCQQWSEALLYYIYIYIW